MNKEEREESEHNEFASELATKWYNDDYGGYHGTADEIVEEFILWVLKNGGKINE